MPRYLSPDLRHPSGLVADAVRVAALVSAVLALFWLPGENAVRFGLLFAVLLLPRFVGIPRPFDAAFCAGLLVATWAGVQDWYVRVPWVDEVVHLLTIGATAAASYLMLAKLQLMPGLQDAPIRRHRSSLLILAAALGLGVAALWEIYEWVAAQFAPQALHVGYDDTVIDIIFGGVGALVAGLALMRWVGTGRDPRPEPRTAGSRSSDNLSR